MCGPALTKLPKSLRDARQLYKKSGVEVAEALKMSAAAYRRYERGEVVPSAAIILQLAELYGCSPNAVMQHGGVEEGQPGDSGVRHNVQLNIEPGDTFTITINATAAADQSENKDDYYQPPFVPSAPAKPVLTRQKAKNKA